jgi:MFS family permease
MPILIKLKGRKAVFLWGVVVFGVFTLVSSFMKNQIAFFVCRGLLGIGAAMIGGSNVGESDLQDHLKVRTNMARKASSWRTQRLAGRGLY